MSTSVFTNGIVSSPPGFASTIPARRPALALAPEPPAQLLQRVGDHDEPADRDAEQDHGDEVPELELPELQVAGARALAPVELLVGQVEPERGDHPHEQDGQEPEGHGDD